jgi:hypothetical protein
MVGDMRIVPLARSVRIQPGRLPFGLIWNRPLAVAWRSADGQQHMLPIRDVTRGRQLMLLGLGLAASLLIWLMFRNAVRPNVDGGNQ